MQNYWPFYTNVKDVIGNADLFDGVNASLANDQFGKPSSVLSLVNGYYKVPNGVYFSGDFTIMVWIKVRNYNFWSRIIDFSLGQTNCVAFSISGDNVGRPMCEIFSTQHTWRVESTVELGLNTWVHFTCTLAQTSGAIYRNGLIVSNTVIAYTAGPQNVVRNSNFIGRGNWQNQDADADFDELKIFNRALSQQEIVDEMNNNMFQ